MNYAQKILEELGALRNEVHALRNDVELLTQLQETVPDEVTGSAETPEPVALYSKPEIVPDKISPQDPEPVETASDPAKKEKPIKKGPSKSTLKSYEYYLKRIESQPHILCELIKLKAKGLTHAQMSSVNKTNNTLKESKIELKATIISFLFNAAAHYGLVILKGNTHSGKYEATDKLRDLVKNPVDHEFGKFGPGNGIKGTTYKRSTGKELAKTPKNAALTRALVDAKNNDIPYQSLVDAGVGFRNTKQANNILYRAKKAGWVTEENENLALTLECESFLNGHNTAGIV